MQRDKGSEISSAQGGSLDQKSDNRYGEGVDGTKGFKNYLGLGLDEVGRHKKTANDNFLMFDWNN